MEMEMTLKHLTFDNVLTNLIGLDLSVILAFYSAGYHFTFQKIHSIKLRFKQRLKETLASKVFKYILSVNIIMTLLYIFLDVKNTGLFLAIFSYFCTDILLWEIGIIIVAFVLLLFFIPQSQDIYNGVELDEKYIKFTNDVGTNRQIYIIAGDFGFLGRVPEKDFAISNHCAQALENLIKSKTYFCNGINESNKCANCVMMKKQFRQLVDKYREKSVNIKILCRKPKPKEYLYKCTIGFLISFFSGITIRFYSNDCPDLPLRGRIIGTGVNSTKIFSHFIKESNQYQQLIECDTDSPEGRTYIGLYDTMWKVANNMNGRRKENKDIYVEYLEEFGQYMQDLKTTTTREEQAGQGEKHDSD